MVRARTITERTARYNCHMCAGIGHAAAHATHDSGLGMHLCAGLTHADGREGGLEGWLNSGHSSGVGGGHVGGHSLNTLADDRGGDLNALRQLNN